MARPGKLWVPEGFGVFISSKAVKALVDGLRGASEIAEDQKRARQLTLGEFMDELRKLPSTALVPLGPAHPYAGEQGAVAFGLSDPGWRPAVILQQCERLLLDTVSYPLGRNTPVWSAERRQAGAMITHLDTSGGIGIEWPKDDIGP